MLLFLFKGCSRGSRLHARSLSSSGISKLPTESRRTHRSSGYCIQETGPCCHQIHLLNKFLELWLPRSYFTSNIFMVIFALHIPFSSVSNFTSSELNPLPSVRVFCPRAYFQVILISPSWPWAPSRLHENFTAVIFQIFVFVVFSCRVWDFRSAFYVSDYAVGSLNSWYIWSLSQQRAEYNFHKYAYYILLDENSPSVRTNTI